MYQNDFCFVEVGTQCDPDEIVQATIKYDGSLGIAFLWNGEVMVTTRRRMDSQQAIWAKQWIGDHCNLSEFQAGYTYLFEIIYQNNTMVVNYPFEGLVLLTITDGSGYELAYEELLRCARTINFFMVTPRIIGPYSEVMWYCGGIEVDQKVITPNFSPFSTGALPVNEKRQEGWVVKFKSGNRLKIIHEWWKNASKLGQLVHPQVVWLLVKHNKVKDVFGDAPIQFKTEVGRMVQAVGRKFDKTLRMVERHLEEARSKDSFCDLEEWWGDKVDKDKLTQDQRGKKIMARIEVCENINDRLRKLLNELEPYRHARFVPAIQLSPTHEITETRRAVNRTPFFHPSKPNFLRLPILNYVCPTTPALKDYQPSENFKQTWCKGWKQLSEIEHVLFAQTVLQDGKSVPPLLQLPVEVILIILKLLTHESLTALAKVCIHLRQIIKSFKAQLLKNRPFPPKYTLQDPWDEEPWKRHRYRYSPVHDWGYGSC